MTPSRDTPASGLREEMQDFRKATMISVNAVREDLLGLRFHIENEFSKVHEGLDAAASGQTQIVDLLNQLLRRTACRQGMVCPVRSEGSSDDRPA